MYLLLRGHNGTGMVVLSRPGWGGENEAALGWLVARGKRLHKLVLGLCCLYKRPPGLVFMVQFRGFGFMDRGQQFVRRLP